jgi:hypothetical protein
MTPAAATATPTPSTPSSRNPHSARYPFRSRASLLHAAPYVALTALVVVLLQPGVVPRGVCGATPSPAVDAFITWSALAFAAVVLLFMASAVLASAQRRGSGLAGPGAWIAGAFAGYATLAGMFPQSPLAAPAELLMLGLVLLTVLVWTEPWVGVIVLPLAIAALVAICGALRGRRPIRAIQLADWLLPLTILPLIMSIAYLTASPVCFD